MQHLQSLAPPAPRMVKGNVEFKQKLQNGSLLNYIELENNK